MQNIHEILTLISFLIRSSLSTRREGEEGEFCKKCKTLWVLRQNSYKKIMG